MMEKTHKHSEDYIGSFSANPHIAQCFQCWMQNDGGKDDTQEWYQKKTMQRDPSEKQTFQNGSVKIQEEMFFCKPHVDSWADAPSQYDSYEEWGECDRHLINTNQKPILVEILN